ncbi:hypothetical protein B0H13DRAFT_2673864 [Mycena leptocephala]|nr:hypothetical protein B0H13DRAFT_2673864 [Mycena leptocephala]
MCRRDPVLLHFSPIFSASHLVLDMPSFVSMISHEDQETISQLCRSVLVEHGTGWMEEDGGTAKITVCVKKLWAEAFRVGYKCGLEKAKNMCCQEDHVPRAAVTEEMEAERVWGYNVGWKLCSELQKASTTASLASLAPPRSLSATTVQTESTVVPNAPVVPDAPLDWAEDAAIIACSARGYSGAIQLVHERQATREGLKTGPFITDDRLLERSTLPYVPQVLERLLKEAESWEVHSRRRQQVKELGEVYYIKAGVAPHATAYEHRQKARRKALSDPRINRAGIKQRSKKNLHAARDEVCHGGECSVLKRGQRVDYRFDDALRQKLPAELSVVVWVDLAQECKDAVKEWRGKRRCPTRSVDELLQFVTG